MKVKTNHVGQLDSSIRVASLLRDWLKRRSKVDRDKEHFWAIGLDTKHNIKYVEVVTIGTLDASLVHPRDVLRMAVMHGVASIIIGHNHPSGDITPSQEDRNVTRSLVRASKLLGIRLLDHVIIGLNGTEFSFAESSPSELRDL